MIYTHITPEEFTDWVNLCAGGFEMPPDEFHDHFVNDPDACFESVFVAFDDTVKSSADACTGCSMARGNATPERGRMVSSVRIFVRDMYLCGEKVRCGAIGEVCTLREYRGKGISGILIKMAIEYMEQNGFAVSQLFTSVNDHYVRYGWFTVPMSYVTSSVKPEKCGGVSLRSVTEADVPFLASLHEKYASKYDGVFARSASPKYWIDWMARNPGYRLIAEKDGKAAAYADFEVKEGQLIFREYLGAPDFAAELFGHIAAEYVGNSDAEKFGAVRLTSIPEPAADILGFSAAAHTERRDFMYRLNKPFTLGGSLIDTPSKLRALLCDAATFAADAY